MSRSLGFSVQEIPFSENGWHRVAITTTGVRVEILPFCFCAMAGYIDMLFQEREGTEQVGLQDKVLAGIGEDDLRYRAGFTQRRPPGEGRYCLFQ